jgi:hypothetical protein
VGEHAHLVALVTTLDDDWMLLIRGADDGISICLEPSFLAHLSPAATEALAHVLEEFATSHRCIEDANGGRTTRMGRTVGVDREGSDGI